MANSDYVGRYGAALRQLHALESGGLSSQLPSALGPDAPQPGGAFGQMPAAPQGGAFDQMAPAAPQGGPPAGAMQAAEPAPMFDKPMSARDLYAQMPPEAKSQLLEQVQKGGMSVDERYDQLVASGEIPDAPPAKKKMSTEDKLGYLAEVALRTISNLSRPGTDSSADWADAALATNQRRGALEQAETERRRGAIEQIRREKREDERDAAKESRADTRELGRDQREAVRRGIELETTQEFTSQQNKLARESAERIAAMREASERNQGKRVLIDEGGNMFTLGDDNKASPITSTEKVTEQVRGKRGVKFNVQREVTKQLKAIPRADAAGIDKDTIMREIGSRIKALTEDGKLARQLKREGKTDIEGEIARRATQQVMEQYGVVSGKQPVGATTPPAGGLSEEDQSLLAKWSTAN